MPGRGLLKFLHHPVEPTFAAGKLAEHFHVIRIRAANCQSFMEEPLKIREIQTTIKIEIGKFIADPVQSFVVDLFQSSLNICSTTCF